MGKRVLAKSAKMGYYRQNNEGDTWDEVGAPNSVYQSVLFNSKVTLPNLGVNVSNFDYAGSTGTSTQEDRVYVDGDSEVKKLPFSGFAYKEIIATELAAILQKVYEYTTVDDVSCEIDSAVLTPFSTIGNAIAVGQTISLEGVTFQGDETATIISINTEDNTFTVNKTADSTESETTLTILDCPKEFVINDDVIDFAGDEGYLHTVAFQNYADVSAGDGVKLNNAILESYTLSISNEGAVGVDKLIKREGTWVGNYADLDVNFTGTWDVTPPTPTYYKGFDMYLSMGTKDFGKVCWKNFQVKFDRTVNRICDTTKANNYTTEIKAEITIDIPYTTGADGTYQMLSKYKEGDKIAVSLYSYLDGILNAYHGNNIAFIFDKAILKSEPIVYDGEYVAIRIVAEVLKPVSGYTQCVILADSIDGGY